VRIDTVGLARTIVDWVTTGGADKFGVIGGPSSDRFFREIYDALQVRSEHVNSRMTIGELFDVPDEAERTRAFVAAHPEVRNWIYLTANNLFHVLPPKYHLPSTGLTAEQSRNRYLYLDMGTEAVRGFWPYENVQRIAVDFETMGKTALRAADVLCRAQKDVSLPPVPVTLTPAIAE